MKGLRLFALVSLASLAATSPAAGTSRSANAQASAVLSHRPPAFLIGHSNSLNWTGYSSYAGNGIFTDVKGSWKQAPAVTWAHS